MANDDELEAAAARHFLVGDGVIARRTITNAYGRLWAGELAYVERVGEHSLDVVAANGGQRFSDCHVDWFDLAGGRLTPPSCNLRTELFGRRDG